MAFDWSKIEGYREGMTDAEKLELLEKVGLPEPTQGMIEKVKFDKVSSELADMKKQLKERMTEDERKESERQAADAALREELETLRRERAFEKHKASFLAQKYDAADAEAMAKALVDNDTDSLFKALTKANDAAEKNLRAELLKGTPPPPTSGKEQPEKSDAIKLAEKLGEADAQAAKAANDGLAHYM